MATCVVVSTVEGSTARDLARRAVETLTRTQKGTQAPVEALRTLRHARWLIDQAEIFWINAARRDGTSWADIGRAQGKTRQAARQAALRRAAYQALEPIDRWIITERRRRAEAKLENTGRKSA